jgi:hypothetical protein
MSEKILYFIVGTALGTFYSSAVMFLVSALLR